MKNYASKAFENLFGKSLAEPVRKYESVLPKDDEEQAYFQKNMTKLIEITFDLDEVPASCSPEMKTLLKSILEEKAKYPTASQAVKDCVARKIPKLMDEGKEQKQAIAIAFSMCRERNKSADENPYSDEKLHDPKDRCLHGQAWGTCEDCVDGGKAEKDRVTAPAALGGKKQLTATGQGRGPVMAVPFEDGNSQPAEKGGGTAPSITAGPKTENPKEKNFPLSDQSLADQTRRAGNEGPNLEPRERPKNPMAVKARNLVSALLEEVRKKAGPGAPPGPAQSAAAREAWRKRHAGGEQEQATPGEGAEDETPGARSARMDQMARRAGLAIADQIEEARAQAEQSGDEGAMAAVEAAEDAFNEAIDAYNEGDHEGAFGKFKESANALQGEGEAPVGEAPAPGEGAETPGDLRDQISHLDDRAMAAYAQAQMRARKDPERADAVKREAGEAKRALEAARGHMKRGEEERAANAMSMAERHTQEAERIASGKAREEEAQPEEKPQAEEAPATRAEAPEAEPEEAPVTPAAEERPSPDVGEEPTPAEEPEPDEEPAEEPPQAGPTEEAPGGAPEATPEGEQPEPPEPSERASEKPELPEEEAGEGEPATEPEEEPATEPDEEAATPVMPGRTAPPEEVEIGPDEEHPQARGPEEDTEELGPEGEGERGPGEETEMLPPEEVAPEPEEGEETQPYEPGEEPDAEAHIGTEVEEAPQGTGSFEDNTKAVEQAFEKPTSESEHAAFFHEEGEKARQQLNDLGGALQDAMDRAEQGDTAGADSKIREAASSMREVGARIERAINTALKEGMFQNISEERHRERLQAAMDAIKAAESDGDPKKRAESLAQALSSLRNSNTDVGTSATRNADAWARIDDPRTKALQSLGSLKDRLDEIPDLSTDSDWKTAIESQRESADQAKAVFEERLADLRDEGAKKEAENEINERIQELEQALEAAQEKASQKKNQDAYRALERSLISDIRKMWDSFLRRLEQAAANEAKAWTPARMLVKGVMDRVLSRANTRPDSATMVLKDLQKSASAKTRAQRLVADVMANMTGANIFDQTVLEPVETIEKSNGGMLYGESGDLKYRSSSGTVTTIAEEQSMATEKSFKDQFFGMVMGSGPKRSLPNILKSESGQKEESIEKAQEEQAKLPGLGSIIPNWARPHSNVAAPNPQSKRMR